MQREVITKERTSLYENSLSRVILVGPQCKLRLPPPEHHDVGEKRGEATDGDKAALCLP